MCCIMKTALFKSPLSYNNLIFYASTVDLGAPACWNTLLTSRLANRVSLSSKRYIWWPRKALRDMCCECRGIYDDDRERNDKHGINGNQSWRTFWASDQVCIVQTRVYTYILSGSICKHVCLRVKFKIRDARKRLCFTEFEYIKVIHAWVNKFHIPHIYNECYLSIF